MQKARLYLMRHRELAAYVTAGVFTTIINYITYGVMTVFCGLDINRSNIIAWTASVITAFFTNKVFVFQKKDWTAASILREWLLFVLSRLLSGVVSIGAVPILMRLGITQSLLNIPGFAAKFLAECIALALSYFLSKYAVFKR